MHNGQNNTVRVGYNFVPGCHLTCYVQIPGDLMSIQALGQTAVIVNSAKIARDLLEKRGSIYSDRPVVPALELYVLFSLSTIPCLKNNGAPVDTLSG